MKRKLTAAFATLLLCVVAYNAQAQTVTSGLVLHDGGTATTINTISLFTPTDANLTLDYTLRLPGETNLGEGAMLFIDEDLGSDEYQTDWLSIGSTDDILTVSNGVPTWKALSVLPNKISLTHNAIIVGDVNDKGAELSAGTQGQVLTINASGSPVWATPSGGGGGGNDSWELAGNAGTTPGTDFLGTTDNQAFQIHVDNDNTTGTDGRGRVMRIEPNASSANIIFGFSGNSTSSAAVGATISGGGQTGSNSYGTLQNSVTGIYSTVGGGRGNVVSGNNSTIGGGYQHEIQSGEATIGGGYRNLINAAAFCATIAGGVRNEANGGNSFMGGGQDNETGGLNSVVAGGNSNYAASAHSAIGGGRQNTASAIYSVVSGGYLNTASGLNSTVGGGKSNTASTECAVVAGGCNNTANGDSSVVSGGTYNVASGQSTTVGGGYKNVASGRQAIVGGGRENTAAGDESTVAGGIWNQANKPCDFVGGGAGNKTVGGSGVGNMTIGGGFYNEVSALNAGILSGNNNEVTGLEAAVVGGKQNEATATGAFVGGGLLNTASGIRSVVSGGSYNVAAGENSTVAGGRGLTLNGDRSFGFLAGNTGSNNMTVGDDNVVVFGNSDLWLANNDGTTSQLRFFEAETGTGAFPSTTHYSSFEAQDQAESIEYILPKEVGVVGDKLMIKTITAVSGQPTVVELIWEKKSSTVINGNYKSVVGDEMDLGSAPEMIEMQEQLQKLQEQNEELKDAVARMETEQGEYKAMRARLNRLETLLQTEAGKSVTVQVSGE